MEYLVHLPAFRILVCKECHHAVLPSQLNSHFHAPPHRFAKAERQRIEDAVALDVPGLIPNETYLQRMAFPFPADTTAPLDALGPARDGGLRCPYTTLADAGCPFVSGSEKKMMKHCREQHGWENRKGKGRPSKHSVPVHTTRPWRSGISYQRFFIQGPKSGFFEVGRNAPRENVSPDDEGDPYDRLLEAMNARHAGVAAAERNALLPIDESMEPSPWQRRVGVGRYLQQIDGVELGQLRELVRPPDAPGEAPLRAVHKALRRVVRRARRVAIHTQVGIFALFEVERKETGERPAKPFNPYLRPASVRRYCATWYGLLSYMVRTQGFPDGDRPPFALTRGQQRSLDKVIQLAGEQATGTAAPNVPAQLEEAILDLVIAALDHPLKDNPYASIVVSGLAILSIEADGRYAELEEYLPRISAVVKIGRLLVLFKAYQVRQASIQRRVQRGIEPAEAEANAPSHISLVQDMVQRFLVRHGTARDPTPTDWLLPLRTYGMKIVYTTPADGSIHWVGDTIHYQSLRFSMNQLRAMVHGLLTEAQQLLFATLLFGGTQEPGEIDRTTLPPIDWGWVDNPTEKAVGWSFLKDVRNRFQADGATWLARRVFGHADLTRQYLCKEGHTVRWGTKAIDQYMWSVERFLDKLFPLVYFANMPPRVPEMLTLRHRNTANGGVRNTFVDQGLVVLVTMYHKGYELSGRLKPIQRFLPKEVSELLLYYLWLVLPFCERVRSVAADVQSFSAFLWGDRSSSGPGDEDSSEGSSSGDDDGSPTLQRTSATRHTRWTADHARRLVQKETERFLGVRFGVAAWRQMAPAIPRRYLRASFGPDVYGGPGELDSDEEDGEAPADSAWDLQSTHQTFTAGMLYGRLASEAEFETADKKEQYRAVSQEWHRFLQFPSSFGAGGPRMGHKRKPLSYWEAANQEARLVRWKQLATTNLYARLQALEGAGARFRGKQEDALQAIVAGHSPVVVVLGTGVGKSLCFMLPASSVPGGTTVVVVPLVALQTNLVERCSKKGILSLVWSSRRPHDTATLLFVTPESALTKAFAGLLNRLAAARQLDRIVVDEVHVVLDGTKDFRPKLRELGDLVARGVQMVYLTATLPPAEEAELFALLHVDRSDLVLVRGPTSRPNIQYQVVEARRPLSAPPAGPGQDDTMALFLEQLVQEKLELYPHPAKVIVYTGSIAAGVQVAETLRCGFYHAKAVGKDQIFQDWLHDRADGDYGERGRVLVASNALGLGIDVPDVRVVVHLGRMRRLKDYAQESGRAGRDGQTSEALVVLHQLPRRPVQAGASDIDRYLSGAICRRIVLDAVMDGRTDRGGCEGSEVVCDLCEAAVCVSDPKTNAGADAGALARMYVGQRISLEKSRIADQAEQLADGMAAWAGRCCHCYGQGHPGLDHAVRDCTEPDAEAVRDAIRTLEYEIRTARAGARFSGCYWCFLPQDLCQRWVRRGDEGGWALDEAVAHCQYDGVLLGAVVALWLAFSDAITPVVDEAMAKDGVHPGDAAGRYIWLGKQVRWGLVESNWLCVVFVMGMKLLGASL